MAAAWTHSPAITLRYGTLSCFHEISCSSFALVISVVPCTSNVRCPASLIFEVPCASPGLIMMTCVALTKILLSCVTFLNSQKIPIIFDCSYEFFTHMGAYRSLLIKRQERLQLCNRYINLCIFPFVIPGVCFGSLADTHPVCGHTGRDYLIL